MSWGRPPRFWRCRISVVISGIALFVPGVFALSAVHACLCVCVSSSKNKNYKRMPLASSCPLQQFVFLLLVERCNPLSAPLFYVIPIRPPCNFPDGGRGRGRGEACHIVTCRVNTAGVIRSKHCRDHNSPFTQASTSGQFSWGPNRCLLTTLFAFNV